jgi:hypothetical protein
MSDCARIRDQLEAYVDGELATARARALEAHVVGNGVGSVGCWECQRRLRSARQLRQALRSLPSAACPDAVVERALAAVRGSEVLGGPEALGGSEQRRRLELVPAPAIVPPDGSERARSEPRFTGTTWRWAWMGVAAAGLLFFATGSLERVGIRWGVGDRTGALATTAEPVVVPPPSEADLAEAHEQARWALAVVASVGRRSALVVRDEVMVAEVLQPSTRAVLQALDPLAATTDRLLHGKL